MTAYAVRPFSEHPLASPGPTTLVGSGGNERVCVKCGGWLHHRDQDGDPACVICGLVTVLRAPAPYCPRPERVRVYDGHKEMRHA
jgi:hypothetical protein